MPILEDGQKNSAHQALIRSLKTRVPKILKLQTPDAPRAIVVVTAHWSEDQPTISSGEKHNLYYDYGGFPAAAYSLKYGASGAPGVAAELKTALEQAGLKPRMDPTRGWDHGVFIPFLLINPAADVPIVQLSVLQSEDPVQHMAMGQALAKLRDSNVAVVGSGFASFHNMGLMRGLMMGMMESKGVKSRLDGFAAALDPAILEDKVEEREKKLKEWRSFPSSYDAHPRGGAEHFLPLLVCAAAGGEGVAKSYKDEFLGVDIWSYYWE